MFANFRITYQTFYPRNVKHMNENNLYIAVKVKQCLNY